MFRKSMAMITLLVVFLGTAFEQTAFADGLFRKLPADGTWTKYFIDLDVNNTLKLSGDVVVRSVGEIAINGKPNRWIEIEFKVEDSQGGNPVHNIYRMLVPEEKLVWGQSPIDALERIIIKTGDSEPMEADANEYKKRLEAPAFFLGGPLKKTKKLADEKVVSYQKGQLKCIGVEGKFELEGTQNNTYDIDQKVWFNDKLPFGIAAREANIAIIDQNGNRTVIKSKLTVNDFGKDAKSGIE